MTDITTNLYCPYCGEQGIIAWDSWDCPDGRQWYDCPKCEKGGKGFAIKTKV